MNDAPLSPEDLRAKALDALGPESDSRARDVLSLARLSIEHDARHWESTAGTVHAHRVLLGLSAETLAHLARTPSILDAVEAALASAVGQRANEAVAELRAYWGVGPPRADAGYRGAVPTEVNREAPLAVRDALVRYLHALGETDLAARLLHAEITVSPARGGYASTLTLAPDAHRALSSDAHAREAVRAALVALLAGPDARKVSVVLHAR